MQLLSIADVCDTYAGGTPDRARPEFFGGDIPWVKSGEVVGLIESTDETLTQEGLKSCSAKWVEPGALLMAMYGAGQTAGQVARLAIRATTNQAVLAIVPKDPSEAQYIGHAIAAAVPDLLRRKQGSGQPNLNADIIRKARLPWPAAELRRRIATTVGAAETAVEHLASLVKAKRIAKRAIAAKILAGEVRFPEFKTRPWMMSRLGNHVRVITRRNGSETTLVLTASGEHGLVDQRYYFNRSVAGTDLSRYYLLRRAEFAYNRSAMKGYPYGSTKRLDAHEAGALSTLYLCFAVTDEALDSDYLKHIFDSGLLNRQLRPIAKVGARAHGLLNVTDEDYLSISIPFPKLDEQRRIARLLNSLDSEIDILSEQRLQTQELKRGLLARLMAGQVSLP
jgi:type I restriction enzyme S subunit